jgi:hypothetical protein
MNKNIKHTSTNYDTCSYEVNGVYQITRIIDLIKDMTYLCFNEFYKYDQFKEYMPHINKYTTQYIRNLTNRKVRSIIEDLFYVKFKIEKLFSNYRFNKVYFTFDDLTSFITYVDHKFYEIAQKGIEQGYTDDKFYKDIEYQINPVNYNKEIDDDKSDIVLDEDNFDNNIVDFIDEEDIEEDDLEEDDLEEVDENISDKTDESTNSK